MTLRDVLGEGSPDVEITALAYDNRSVSPGTLFFCVPGATRDGHDFAPDAVRRGAAALVVERPLALGVPEIVVPSARAAMAPAAARLAGDPSATLKVVGITGTNGKTTTAFLLRHLLEHAGLPCGLLGTIRAVVGGEERGAVRTTPEAIDLQPLLGDMLARGDVACAMEVSSHALALHRADAIHFAVAVFTNLSQDHLDFHPDMDAYFATKRTLFERADVARRVVCVDDAYGHGLAHEFPDAVTVSTEGEADLAARDVAIDLHGSRFTLVTPDGEHAAQIPLPGRFNVRNALCAVAAARALGADDAALIDGLAVAPPVPGRFEPVDEGQPFAVLVDYAHTPDSLENVLRAAREVARREVICVFGAGGDRDRGKRPLMGAAAAAFADRAIVTSDNPRSEDPAAIVAQVAAGAGPDAEIEIDRRAAIRRAIGAAAPGDVVVIAGKGHEQGQDFGGGRVEPFNDVDEARRALREEVVR